MQDPSDVAIILDKYIGSKKISLTFGPFLGEDEIEKRNLNINNPSVTELIKDMGLCYEFRFFNETKTANFADYKEIAKTEKEYIQKLWEL